MKYRVFFKKIKNMNNKRATYTYLSRIGSKTQNKQAEQKQNHRYREDFDCCQMGRGPGEMREKDEGIKKYKYVTTE